ncbi:hypothetical protein DTO013E5_5423 [Penicillium roqueforti]|nr:hypothetical protein CBS147337_9179 [Penicillium roqueforti]KAI2740382.1 hypothetical protein DTO012A1_5297 [Penicillium roqueforti]KAI2752810.1 hypothetical protein DTO013F2_3039 [Penicillium roqueforti]KAI2759809.1 hypothetical protein DTO006G1_5222 [Penicillium roqueforti]KAI2773797.1 hypothetical protein DTO012A8_1619 [Penicillium roqueforti]
MATSLREPMTLSRPTTWNFDIDRYLNPFVPAPRWHLVPRPVAYMLGYRDRPPKPLGNIVVAFWASIGAFCGVALVASVSKRVPSFKAHDATTILGSFGAAAVIEFGTINSPLAQPRNAILSQIIACFFGVGISKLFALDPRAEAYTELGGALACALTTASMLLTNTMHPPAGATALLAVTQSQTIALGWFLFPVVLLGVALMQAAAVVINNVQRQYPLYWWTSYPLSPRGDVEKASRKERLETPSEDSLTGIPRRLVVEQSEVSVPDGILLSAEEEDVLERILRTGFYR